MAVFFQFLADGAVDLASFLVGFLPQSPDFVGHLYGFIGFSDLPHAFAVLNWFVPVSGIVELLLAWVSACLLYMAVRWAVSLYRNRG